MIQLGCIADDFTGATDLANNLVRSGMRVLQTIGVPNAPLDAEVDALVVALKSRTIAPAAAVAQSLEALDWLRALGARQIYFKYCSTFDSTAQGNIGPVTEALMDALGADFSITTPAFPDNQRSVYQGHLFVGDALLNESGMQNHPLTPMADANLVRVMQAQCRRKVGLLLHAVVAGGPDAIRAEVGRLKAAGVAIAVADAISNQDLMSLAQVLDGMPMLGAGSGLALGLPRNFSLRHTASASGLPRARGKRAIVSGSCSVATNRQVADFILRGHAAYALDPLRLASGIDLVPEVLAWAQPRLASGPVLVYSSAAPDAVKSVQAELGVERAGGMVEQALGRVARGLVNAGVYQLVVAGGETSGACVQALGVREMSIGPQIDPGVPWCHARPYATDADGLHLALKSGNFGADDFFTKAFALLP